MSLYAWIILFTILGPFALSFDKKVHFYTYWKALFPAIFLVATGFLIWDEYFARCEIWGFNPTYLLGVYFGHLPLEEVLFFLVVPYACIFIYEVLPAYFNLSTEKIGKLVAFIIGLSSFIFAFLHGNNWYTVSACTIAGLLTVGSFFVYKVEWYGKFAFAFVVCIIPFLIVNGILTGAVTPKPIVWYAENHIMGPRIVTIPVEDIFYNYCMLLPIVWIYERFKKTNWFMGSNNNP
jgi:lycopene cyclase domain-containing protein